MYLKGGKWTADMLDEVVDWHTYQPDDDLAHKVLAVHLHDLVYLDHPAGKCIDGCHCKHFEPIDYARLLVVAISAEADAAMQQEEDAAKERARERSVQERQARKFVR